MLNGGELDGVRILGRKTIELMTLNHIGDNEVWLVGPGYGFGLGYAVVQDPGAAAMPYSVGSYFWWGAFNTTFWVDPEEELIGILMTQLRPYTHAFPTWRSLVRDQGLTDTQAVELMLRLTCDCD